MFLLFPNPIVLSFRSGEAPPAWRRSCSWRPAEKIPVSCPANPLIMRACPPYNNSAAKATITLEQVFNLWGTRILEFTSNYVVLNIDRSQKMIWWYWDWDVAFSFLDAARGVSPVICARSPSSHFLMTCQLCPVVTAGIRQHRCKFLAHSAMWAVALLRGVEPSMHK